MSDLDMGEDYRGVEISEEGIDELIRKTGLAAAFSEISEAIGQDDLPDFRGGLRQTLDDDDAVLLPIDFQQTVCQFHASPNHGLSREELATVSQGPDQLGIIRRPRREMIEQVRLGDPNYWDTTFTDSSLYSAFEVHFEKIDVLPPTGSLVRVVFLENELSGRLLAFDEETILLRVPQTPKGKRNSRFLRKINRTEISEIFKETSSLFRFWEIFERFFFGGKRLRLKDNRHPWVLKSKENFQRQRQLLRSPVLLCPEEKTNEQIFGLHPEKHLWFLPPNVYAQYTLRVLPLEWKGIEPLNPEPFLREFELSSSLLRKDLVGIFEKENWSPGSVPQMTMLMTDIPPSNSFEEEDGEKKTEEGKKKRFPVKGSLKLIFRNRFRAAEAFELLKTKQLFETWKPEWENRRTLVLRRNSKVYQDLLMAMANPGIWLIIGNRLGILGQDGLIYDLKEKLRLSGTPPQTRQQLFNLWAATTKMTEAHAWHWAREKFNFHHVVAKWPKIKFLFTRPEEPLTWRVVEKAIKIAYEEQFLPFEGVPVEYELLVNMGGGPQSHIEQAVQLGETREEDTVRCKGGLGSSVPLASSAFLTDKKALVKTLDRLTGYGTPKANFERVENLGLLRDIAPFESGMLEGKLETGPAGYLYPQMLSALNQSRVEVGRKIPDLHPVSEAQYNLQMLQQHYKNAGKDFPRSLLSLHAKAIEAAEQKKEFRFFRDGKILRILDQKRSGMTFVITTERAVEKERFADAILADENRKYILEGWTIESLNPDKNQSSEWELNFRNISFSEFILEVDDIRGGFAKSFSRSNEWMATFAPWSKTQRKFVLGDQILLGQGCREVYNLDTKLEISVIAEKLWLRTNVPVSFRKDEEPHPPNVWIRVYPRERLVLLGFPYTQIRFEASNCFETGDKKAFRSKCHFVRWRAERIMVPLPKFPFWEKRGTQGIVNRWDFSRPAPSLAFEQIQEKRLFPVIFRPLQEVFPKMFNFIMESGRLFVEGYTDRKEEITDLLFECVTELHEYQNWMLEKLLKFNLNEVFAKGVFRDLAIALGYAEETSEISREEYESYYGEEEGAETKPVSPYSRITTILFGKGSGDLKGTIKREKKKFNPLRTSGLFIVPGTSSQNFWKILGYGRNRTWTHFVNMWLEKLLRIHPVFTDKKKYLSTNFAETGGFQEERYNWYFANKGFTLPATGNQNLWVGTSDADLRLHVEKLYPTEIWGLEFNEKLVFLMRNLYKLPKSLPTSGEGPAGRERLLKLYTEILFGKDRAWQQSNHQAPSHEDFILSQNYLYEEGSEEILVPSPLLVDLRNFLEFIRPRGLRAKEFVSGFPSENERCWPVFVRYNGQFLSLSPVEEQRVEVPAPEVEEGLKLFSSVDWKEKFAEIIKKLNKTSKGEFRVLKKYLKDDPNWKPYLLGDFHKDVQRCNYEADLRSWRIWADNEVRKLMLRSSNPIGLWRAYQASIAGRELPQIFFSELPESQDQVFFHTYIRKYV